jgi:hypothetical protein
MRDNVPITRSASKRRGAGFEERRASLGLQLRNSEKSGNNNNEDSFRGRATMPACLSLSLSLSLPSCIALEEDARSKRRDYARYRNIRDLELKKEESSRYYWHGMP